MVADTAITSVTRGLRDRRLYQPKIEAGGGASLIGYVGNNAYNAQRVALAVAKLPAGEEALATLLAEHLACPESEDVEFAYGFLDASSAPRLFKVADGVCKEVQQLHLGSDPAYRSYERIRTSRKISHAPNALHLLMGGLRGAEDVPEELQAAIRSLFELFSSVNERDVGGWVTPYVLDVNGAKFFSYVYSVSDPIADELRSGMLIPHGTAEGGGFGISVTDFPEQDGLVVYWKQSLIGYVLLRSGQSSTGLAYREYVFEGAPDSFKMQVFDTLRRNVHVWFGDKPAGAPLALSYLRDEQGKVRMASVEHEGGTFTNSWIQVGPESFAAKAHIEMTYSPEHRRMLASESLRLTTSAADDLASASVSFTYLDNEPLVTRLSANDIDHLIATLADLRRKLLPEIPKELEPGTKLMAQGDPIWRTQGVFHSLVGGALLSLRHSGLGWTTFILPMQEVETLGKWLVEFARGNKI